MNYDDWKSTPPDLADDYDDPIYDEDEESMTTIKDLHTTRERLSLAAQNIKGSMTCAVLSRARREKLDALQQSVHDAIADIDDELEVRA